MSTLSPQEWARYARHIAIPEFGEEGQRKLKEARVLVVGAGGLGSPLLLYLAAAGVGKIGIAEYDIVDESNLQRQVLYGVQDVGLPKGQKARERMLELNPHIEVVVHPTALTRDNALDLIEDYDIVADGTDNFPTRYLVNDACVLRDKVNVYASVFRFEGQVAVFNHPLPDGGRSSNYRDMFPEPPPPGMVPNCAEGGVLGVLPGIIGSLQANEVIKVITGVGEPLVDRIFLFDAAGFTTRTLRIRKHPDAPPIRELIDYEEFCGIPRDQVPEISVQELRTLRESKADFQLIDVREPYEYDIANLQGELIPLGSLEEEWQKISRDKPVVVHCRSGRRSADAIRSLRDDHGFHNLHNLKGGILAWSREIDPDVPTY